MTRVPRIAVLGCGMIVRRGHLPGLLAHARASVPVLYGPDTPNSHALAGAFGIARLVHTVEEVFATPGLDGAVVALPNHQHAAAALASIRAGVPILLEKPIASTIEAARSIIAAARDAGVGLVMSLPQRQRPTLIRLKQLISSGELGRVQSIDVRLTRRAGIPGYGGWFTRRALSGGGVLMDLGPHVVDVAFWLAGCSEAVGITGRLWSTHGRHGRGLGDWGSARGRSGPADVAFDVEDRAWLAFELACGTHVTCEVSWAACGAQENRIRIVGDRAGADYWPERHGVLAPLTVYRDGADGIPTETAEPLAADHDPLDHAWARVAEAFVDDLASGHSHLVSGTDALAAAELIQRVYEVAPVIVPA